MPVTQNPLEPFCFQHIAERSALDVINVGKRKIVRCWPLSRFSVQKRAAKIKNKFKTFYESWSLITNTWQMRRERAVPAGEERTNNPSSIGVRVELCEILVQANRRWNVPAQGKKESIYTVPRIHVYENKCRSTAALFSIWIDVRVYTRYKCVCVTLDVWCVRMSARPVIILLFLLLNFFFARKKYLYPIDIQVNVNKQSPSRLNSVYDCTMLRAGYARLHVRSTFAYILLWVSFMRT